MFGFCCLWWRETRPRPNHPPSAPSHRRPCSMSAHGGDDGPGCKFFGRQHIFFFPRRLSWYSRPRVRLVFSNLQGTSVPILRQAKKKDIPCFLVATVYDVISGNKVDQHSPPRRCRKAGDGVLHPDARPSSQNFSCALDVARWRKTVRCMNLAAHPWTCPRFRQLLRTSSSLDSPDRSTGKAKMTAASRVRLLGSRGTGLATSYSNANAHSAVSL